MQTLLLVIISMCVDVRAVIRGYTVTVYLSFTVSTDESHIWLPQPN